MIAKDKVIPHKKQRFIFSFTDAIFYIEYDEKLFKRFRCQYFQRAKRIDKDEFMEGVDISDKSINNTSDEIQQLKQEIEKL